MVNADRCRGATSVEQSLKSDHNASSGKRGVNLDGQALTRAVVDHRQAAKRTAVAQAVGDEVPRPADVQCDRLGQRLAFNDADALALAPPYRESLLTVESLHAFAVHHEALAVQ